MNTAPKYLAVWGRGDPGAIDAYLYGDNGRAFTVSANGQFATVVVVTTTGGFGAGPQSDRLASGLYGAQVFLTFDGAMDAVTARGILSS